MKLIIIVVLMAGIGLVIGFILQRNPLQHSIFEGFDTWIEIDIPSRQQQVASTIETIIRNNDQRWDRFIAKSEIWTINHSQNPVVVDQNTVDILFRAQQLQERTDGYYNFLIGSLMDEWGFTDHPRIPSPVRLRVLTEQTIGSEIKIDQKAKTVLRLGSGTIDLGGIAKGYLVDLIVKECRRNKIDRALINAGGTVYALGKTFRVGILHPRRESLIGVVEVKNQAVSTSGDYFRYFEENGVRYYHILNPFTGYPSHDFTGVTIIYPEATEADVISTAIMAGGLDLIPVIEQRFPGIAIIAIRPGGELVVNSSARPFFQTISNETIQP